MTLKLSSKFLERIAQYYYCMEDETHRLSKMDNNIMIRKLKIFGMIQYGMYDRKAEFAFCEIFTVAFII